MGVTLCSLTVKIKTKDLMQSWGDGSSVCNCQVDRSISCSFFFFSLTNNEKLLHVI